MNLESLGMRLGTHRFSLRSKPTFAVGFPEVSEPYNEYMSLVIVLVLMQC